MIDFDVAIIGGGCAGLSLGRDLARCSQHANSLPSVLIIEPRMRYENDRTWCFWDRARASHPLATKQWSSWRFSSGAKVHVHSSKNWSYFFVPSLKFYKQSTEFIQGCAKTKLELGCSVESICSDDEGFLVKTSKGDVRVLKIVDTRPPDGCQLSKSSLFQQFSGIEVQCSHTIQDSGVAGIMDNLAGDENGVRFDYLLPISSSRLLIETTRFSPRLLSAGQLDNELQETVSGIPEARNARCLRSESGVIPMGMHLHPRNRRTGWITAGTRGGAVRAASGYAFRRIQKWSSICARSIARGRGPIPHRLDKKLLQAMDRLFLQVIRDDPEFAAEAFMKLAQNVPADRLVRFLSDKGSPADLVSVISGLPSLPFLKGLAKLRSTTC